MITRRWSGAAFICAACLACILAFSSVNQMVSVYAIKYDSNGLPLSLSGDEFIIVRDTALSDSRVQQLIGGRNYSIGDCCGFTKSGQNAPWQPVMNILVAKKLSIAVTVDLDSRKVTNIEAGEYVQHQVPSSEKTAADKITEQTTNYGGSTASTFFLATNASNVLPLILTIGIALGGATMGTFYYLKKRPKRPSSMN